MRQCDALGNVYLENVGLGIHMDVTLTHLRTADAPKGFVNFFVFSAPPLLFSILSLSSAHKLHPGQSLLCLMPRCYHGPPFGGVLLNA